MKISKKLAFAPVVLLLTSYFFKLAVLPNQLLLIGVSFILILVYLIFFLIREMKSSRGFGQKMLHFLFFLLTLLVLFLPFVGVFDQGLVPIIIYGALSCCVVFYLIKINRGSIAGSNETRFVNYRNFVLLNLILIILNSPFQWVIPDKYYTPDFIPEYATEKGPEIIMDEAHYNYHTSSGLYTAFANILRKDGYVVKPFTNRFSNNTLQGIKILVISNALNKRNSNNWEMPVYSAFEEEEIKSLNDWVNNGGSLFLIADHAPFGSAAKKLAATFGFSFSDGTASKKVKGKPDLFCRQKNMLQKNIVTDGRNSEELVDSVVTYTGQAFKIPDSAKAILLFNDEYIQYPPWALFHTKGSSPQNINGFAQGAFMNYGKGRIAVSGEAAMFSGQLGAGLSWKKIGLNASEAKNNYKLLLNIVHWLDHKIN